jgi:hypothetical protein
MRRRVGFVRLDIAADVERSESERPPGRPEHRREDFRA